jgi:tetratricopeptide (TPR) repeat protein
VRVILVAAGLILLASAPAAESPDALVAEARSSILRGRREEALKNLDQALSASPDHLGALAAKGRLLDRMGRREEASRIFASFPDRVKPGVKTAADLTALAVGCQEHALRVHDKALLKEVMSTLYTGAQKADPAYLPARHEAGLLFAMKHQYSQAAAEFEAALQADTKDAVALAGIAMTVWGQGDFGGAQEACRKALALDPAQEDALLLMAAMAVWDEEDAEAAGYAAKALEANPACLEALGLQAGLGFLAGDAAKGGERLKALEGLCPGWPDACRIVGGAFESRHRDRDAIAWYQRGLKVAPEDPGLLSDLGMVFLHVSREKEGRALLEKAYGLDPFDSRLSNILNLLDDLKDWPVLTTRHFRIRCHPDERDLLGDLLAESLERDYAELTPLYGYEPHDQPIDVEMYPEQSDFAVRTIGQPMIGALGVCFGRFIAVDSPAVQAQMEPFHWADVARHEFCHVVTLQLSDFRVPRWLTEGLSVYSERYPRLPFDTLLVSASAEGRILGMAELNKAFSRPAYPGQTQLAYAQGGEIVRFVAETHGFAAIKRMLKAYRDGQDTGQVIRKVFGMSLKEFDQAFREALAGRLKSVQCFPMIHDEALKKLEGTKPLPAGAGLVLARQYLARRKWSLAETWARQAREKDATGEATALLGAALLKLEKTAEAEPLLREAIARRPEHYLGHAGLARILQGRGETEAALSEFRLARRCYPHHAEGSENPYRGEATCCFSLGRTEEGIAALKALCAMNGLDTTSRLDLARALRDSGKSPEALAVLDDSLFGDVHTPAVHALRGELLKALGRPAEAAAALGLGSHAAPKDLEAAVAAAQAWLDAGDKEKARRFWERAKGIQEEDPRVREMGERIGKP